jgi:hypothetical protein
MAQRARRLKIRGQNWRIVIARPPENNCIALCVYDERTIYIRPSCADRAAAIVHEILHACFRDLEEKAVEEAEEAIVKGLELIFQT